MIRRNSPAEGVELSENEHASKRPYLSDPSAAAISAVGELEDAIARCATACEAGEVGEVAQALRSRGYREQDCATVVERVGAIPDAARQVAALREVLGSAICRDAALERLLLLEALRRQAPRLRRLRLGEGMLRCLADELRFLAAPPSMDCAQLLAPSSGFVSMAMVVTGRRFPAGQLHVERSGIPLSWLLRLSPRSGARTIAFLARHLQGCGPLFFQHLAWRRRNRFSILEREQNRSYFRIAQSLALNPELKGLATESWLHSPDTFAVSPHLAWLNKPFLEHGGMVTVIGPASSSSGVLAKSAQRKRLYDEGKFHPTTALVVWPRAAILDWATSHPEFGE